jgi:hypothetical protein
MAETNVEEPTMAETNVAETKYKNGKIYCLYCDDESYYIGSTITELRFRLRDHKQAAKKYPGRRVYKHINEIGWENVKIECIEEYPCNSLEELLQKEDEYIEAMIDDENCLNIKSAYSTEEEKMEYIKQYRKEHRDRILEYKKKYRQENSEKISEYTTQYVKKHSEEVKERRQQYIKENKEKVYKKMKEYAEKHKDEIAAYKKKWAEDHKDELDKKGKEYREKNRTKLAEKGKEYYEENKEACQKRMKERREKNLEKCKEMEKKYREKRKQENPEVSIPCDVCGGSYLPHHKKRHISSKKHQSKITN